MNRNFKMFSLLTVVFSMLFVLFSSQVTYAQQSVIGVIKWGRDAIKTGIAPIKTKDFIRAVSEDEVTDYGVNKVLGKEHDFVETVAEKAIYDAGGAVVCVAGSSGSAIMHTMGGTAHLPAAAGFGTAYELNKHVFNGESSGDKAARKGTYVGAAAGTAVSAGAIATYGAGASGLATIGGFVGGGMAAGATAVIAAPVAGAVAVGFLCKWLWD